MTVTALTLPVTQEEYDIPLVEFHEPGETWFRLRPLTHAIEQAFRQHYGIRYLHCTALTSLLQIRERYLIDKF